MAFVIGSVTQARIAALAKVINNSGGRVQAISRTEFEVQGHGVLAAASLNEETGDLTVEVKKKPFYVSLDRIQAQLKEELAKAPPTSDPVPGPPVVLQQTLTELPPAPTVVPGPHANPPVEVPAPKSEPVAAVKGESAVPLASRK